MTEQQLLLICSPLMRQRILQEYNMDEHQMRELKNVLRCHLQRHLPHVQAENHILEAFLVRNKFRMDVAQRKLLYYFQRHFLVDTKIYHMDGTTASSLVPSEEDMYYVPLPHLTPNLERVFVTRAHNLNIGEHNRYRMLLFICILTEAVLCTDLSLYDCVIIDCIGHNFLHAIQQPWNEYRKLYLQFQKVFTARLRHVHLVNCAPFVAKCVSILHGLFPVKRERFLIHTDMESLHRYIPPEYLPSEYGGTLGALHTLQVRWDSVFRQQIVPEYLRRLADQSSSNSAV